MTLKHVLFISKGQLCILVCLSWPGWWPAIQDGVCGSYATIDLSVHGLSGALYPG